MPTGYSVIRVHPNPTHSAIRDYPNPTPYSFTKPQTQNRACWAGETKARPEFTEVLDLLAGVMGEIHM